MLVRVKSARQAHLQAHGHEPSTDELAATTGLEVDQVESLLAAAGRPRALAFAAFPAWIICAYDANRLPDRVIETAWRAHPKVLDGDWQRSPHFEDPAELVLRSRPPPPRFTSRATCASARAWKRSEKASRVSSARRTCRRRSARACAPA